MNDDNMIGIELGTDAMHTSNNNVIDWNLISRLPVGNYNLKIVPKKTKVLYGTIESIRDSYESVKPKRETRCCDIGTVNDKAQIKNREEISCYRCKRRGHTMKYCTAKTREIESRKYGGGNAKGRCFYCNSISHFARECRKKQGEEIKKERKDYRNERIGNSCNYCKKNGYTYRFCRKRRRDQERCSYCGVKEHAVRKCNKIGRDQ